MVKQFIKQVTVTGADDLTNPNSLIELSNVYPFVEFGILVSKSNSGLCPRFPSQRWLDNISNIKRFPMKLSMHLCGYWVRSIADGKGDIFKEWISNYFTMFNRIQLNFHGQPHLVDDNFYTILKEGFNVPIIFQLDGTNDALYNLALKQGVSAQPLYDLSGGTGILPNNWLPPQSYYTGYAGGLSPTNLKTNLDILSNIININSATIWIDAETHLRSNNDTLFDISKVAQFLKIAKPFILDTKSNRVVVSQREGRIK